MTGEKQPFLVMAAPDELAAFAKRAGLESYRANQVERWISKRWTADPDAMTDLSQSVRQKLREGFLCDTVKIRSEHFSSDGAGKLLLELRDGELIECALIPAADGRMVTFASTIPEQGCCYHLPDLISINAYPGWYETSDWTEIHPLHRISPCLSKIEDFFSTPEYKDKPLIISEIGAGAVFGCHDRLKAHWSEEYQADYLAEACRCVLGSKRICGMAVWHFADCRTYAAAGGVLKRPRGFNNKGILDEYRRPKLAYDTIKRLYGG